MRKFLQQNRWFTFLVIGLLLFATSGTMVSRMTCLIGGHSELTIGLVEECCPHEEHDGAVIGPQCCDVGQTDQLESSFIAGADLHLVVFLLSLDALPFTTIISTEPTTIPWLQSRPPPEDFGERAARLGSLLI